MNIDKRLGSLICCSLVTLTWDPNTSTERNSETKLYEKEEKTEVQTRVRPPFGLRAKWRENVGFYILRIRLLFTHLDDDKERITGKMEGTFLWQPFRRKNGGFLPSTPASFFARRPGHLCLFTPFLSIFDCMARAGGYPGRRTHACLSSLSPGLLVTGKQ